ncbi:MAG TPA: hypothetical protein VNI20_02255 [Fimbriimonadaceae bacterium]|nr:hypothetical protein [Fimbriimonadaceae bacterium]
MLYVGLDRFYSSLYEPPPPTVVHHAGTVLDCCQECRARRIRPGTPLAEARTILRSEARYVEFRLADYVDARDRWLDVCLLYSSLIEHESPASAWIDLHRHPDQGDIAVRLLADVWRATALTVRAAIAPSRWVAKTAARTCDPSALALGITDVPTVCDQRSYLAQLPTRMLAPVPAEHRQRLDFLGYRRIGDVQRAPLHLLMSQFGKDAFIVQEAAHGRLSDPVVPNYPRASIEGVRTFDGPVCDRNVLLVAMREIADDLGSALRRSDLLAGSTETVLSLESGVMLRHVRRLPKPSDSLSLSLQHQLDRTSITAPVVGLRVTVPDLRPVPAIQRALDSAERTETQRSAESTVRELCSAFGDGTVKPASKIELPRRDRVLRAWKSANGWR